MLGIPHLNVVYEDQYVTMLIHDVEGNGKLLVLHVDVLPTTNRKILNHYFACLASLELQLKERGVKELEAWVSTDEEIRYAYFFGFNDMLGELSVNGQLPIPSVYRLKKEL